MGGGRGGGDRGVQDGRAEGDVMVMSSAAGLPLSHPAMSMRQQVWCGQGLWRMSYLTCVEAVHNSLYMRMHTITNSTCTCQQRHTRSNRNNSI